MKTSLRHATLGCALLHLFGCSGSDDDASTSPTGDVSAGGTSADPTVTDEPAGPIYSGGCDAIPLAPPARGHQLEMPLTVEAGSEGEYCQLVMLDEDLNLNATNGLYTTGSHHALVHRTTYKGAIPTTTVDGTPFDGDPTVPHPCLTPNVLWDVTGVLAGGRNVALRNEPDTSVGGNLLPGNVAMRLEAGDVVVVNFHMINAQSDDVDACYKVNLQGIEDAAVEEEAGIFFLYDPFITVPANGTATSRRTCPVTRDVTLLSAVSHMHARGVGSEAYLYDGNPVDGATEVMKFYDIPEWAEPPMVKFDDPVSLQAGQWIDWRCAYDNPENRDVAQGFASTDEMCMFIGMYYPRDFEMEQCGGQQSLGAGVGSGTRNGQDFVDCLFGSTFTFIGSFDDPDRYQTLSCFTETCPEVAPAVYPFMHCLGANGDPTACAAEQATLTAATCN